MALKQVKSLADIGPPEKGSVDIVRGDETYRIPLKVLSASLQEEITGKMPAPAAPEQWKKNPNTGKPTIVSNEADPAYQAEIKAIETRQTQAFILEGIGIEIEGETIEEKWANLAEQFSLGELNIVIQAIMELSKLSEEAISDAKNSLNRIPASTQTVE